MNAETLNIKPRSPSPESAEALEKIEPERKPRISDGSSSTYTFCESIADIPVTFYIIKMKNCLFVWIGDKGNFENLAVAMNTSYNAMPIATSVMGHLGNDHSCSLATKLSKKTGKQVFASFNLSKIDDNILLNVSQILLEKIKNYPDKF